MFSYVAFPMLPEHLRQVDPDGLNVTATNLYEGKGLINRLGDREIYFDPLYPIFIASLYEVFGPQVWVLQLSAILLHGATIVLVYAIARRLYPARKLVALAAAAAFGLYPHAIWYLPRAQMTTLNTFLIASFILSTLYLIESPNWKKGAISGLVLGLCALTKGATLLFPLALLPVLFIMTRGQKRLITVSWLSLVFAVIMVMTPSFIRNYDIFGRFQPTSRGGESSIWGDFMVDYDPGFIPVKGADEMTPGVLATLKELRQEAETTEGEITDAEWQLYLQRQVIRNVLEEPATFLRKVVWQLPRFWVLSSNYTKTTLLKIAHSAILPLAVLGIVFSLRDRTRILVVLTFVLYYMGVHAAVVAVAGHSLPVMPYVLTFAMYGLANLVQWATRLHPRLMHLMSMMRGLR
jgi:4-amino-4-deoxy-L-arabinose transferase-like glycosyltransferase